MIRRILALALIVWLLGLALFIVLLPGPAVPAHSDGIIVLTGAKGRIERGIDLLEAQMAQRMLVSGVDPAVRPAELAAIQKVPTRLITCCVELGKDAVDTRTNAEESVRWIRLHQLHTVRLVTSDWHMPRARFELERVVGPDVMITTDAVESAPGLAVLVLEYNKYWLRRISALFGI